MQLILARIAAQARETARKRPKKTTLPSCLRKRYCPSFSLHLLPSLLPCSDGHLLGLTLTACDADPLGTALLADRKQNREDPIFQLRLDRVGIDRPGEGHHPFKRAREDFS